MKPTTPAKAAEATPTPSTEEPRNVAVDVIKNCTRLKGAILAVGRCPFPLTMSEAKTAEAMGLVRIVGIA